MRAALIIASLVVAGVLGVVPGHAEKRIALVIGNGAYAHAQRLPNPRNDAEDVAAALRRAGFEMILGMDLDKAGMDDATSRFARAARTADVAIFYYSGHAIQFAGVNYLMPVDARLTDEVDLRRMARVDEIVADQQQAKSLRILVLDSCRDNPLAEQLKRSIGLTRAASVQHGLARIDSPEGMIVAYATQAGRTAEDGNGRNSPYTAAFLKHIGKKEEIGTVFRLISADVYEATNRAQLPELSLSFIGQFYLNGPISVTINPAAQPAPADPCATAGDHWRSAEAIGTVAAFEDHLARFRNCAFAGLAKARIESLRSKEAVVAPPVPPTGPVTLQTGLVGYWPLDSDTTSWTTNTTQDASGGGNAGALVRMSATTNAIPGKIGGALKFNGTNSVQTSYSGISGTSARTISLWLKTTQTSPLARKNTSTLLAYGNAHHCATPGYFVVASNDKYGGSTNYPGISVDFPCHAAITYDAAIYDDKWHHVVVIMPKSGTTSNLKVYVDGVLLTRVNNVYAGQLRHGQRQHRADRVRFILQQS
jgi:hypothetical protein